MSAGDFEETSLRSTSTTKSVRQLGVAVVIFAKDEERNIAKFLTSLASQTLMAIDEIKLKIYVVANGCVDNTVKAASDSASQIGIVIKEKIEILDWPTPGKSRSWNRFMHEVLPENVDYVFCVDADIEFLNENILSSMLVSAQNNKQVEVVSGNPIKNNIRKSKRTLVDRFSANVSSLASYSQSICGQLYLTKRPVISEIWMPDETPAEDGFLNAMIRTDGFTQEFQPDVLMEMRNPTHYYEDHSIASFFTHETRMIVGTMINRWIFEYLNSLQLSEKAGYIIERLNRDNPEWVNNLIEKESAGTWLVSKDLVLRRLKPKATIGPKFLLHFPVLLLATVLTLPPAFKANRILKKRGAASTW